MALPAHPLGIGFDVAEPTPGFEHPAGAREVGTIDQHINVDARPDVRLGIDRVGERSALDHQDVDGCSSERLDRLAEQGVAPFDRPGGRSQLPKQIPGPRLRTLDFRKRERDDQVHAVPPREGDVVAGQRRGTPGQPHR